MGRFAKELKSQSVLRYIVAFSSIVVVIIIVMGGYLYRFYYRTIYNDFLASGANNLTHIVNRHENDMQILNDIVMQIGLSADVTDFLLQEQPEKSLRLEEQLHQYITVSQFFGMLFYYYHKDTYLYNHTTSVEMELLLRKGLMLEETGPDTLKQLFCGEAYGTKILPEQGAEGYLLQRGMSTENRVVTYFCPIPPKNTSTVIFLTGASYYDDLLQTEEEQRLQNYIIYQGQIITERGQLELLPDTVLKKAANVQEKMDGQHIWQEKVELEGRKYLLSAEQGSSGLLYCSFQSMEVFQNKVLTNQWGILLLLLLCSIPASLAIVLFSRPIFAKVRNMNLMLNETEEDYYDLNSLESGIQMLVQTHRENVKESREFRRARFIRSFIRGDYGDREEMCQAAKKAELTISHDCYIVVLMGDRGNSNESKAHSLMLREMEQEGQIDGYGINLINSNQSLFVLFGDKKELMERVLEKMMDYGKQYCEDFIMSVSDYHQDYMDGSKAYLEADTAYDNRFLMDNSKILRFAEVASTQEVEILPENYLYRLKKAILTGEKQEVENAVLEICSRMKGEKRSLLTFRLMYNDLIRMLAAQFRDNGADCKEIYNVFTLSQCLTIHDFNDVLCEACQSLMEKQAGGEQKKSDMVSEATAYMKANYQNADLNMSSLAEYLQISPVTLAVEFKNGTGMNPSDYLTGMRMERAKELLRNTDMLVREISAAVGYQDDHVFMRRFKKYTGKTPGQYREE